MSSLPYKLVLRSAPVEVPLESPLLLKSVECVPSHREDKRQGTQTNRVNTLNTGHSARNVRLDWVPDVTNTHGDD